MQTKQQQSRFGLNLVRLRLLLLALAFFAVPATGLAADEASKGLLYAFAPDMIAIIDPISGQVVKEITDGLTDVDWGESLVTPDNRYVIANDSGNSQVVVIDTFSQTIVRRIPVGLRPVHVSNPLHGDEIWTHADGEGAFYVIDLVSFNVVARVVTAGAGHGKLLYSDTLGSKAYATNVTVPEVFQIDLATHNVTGRINVCGESGGTHGKAFSEANRHAYFECVNGSIAVLDTGSDKLLHNLPGGGQVFAGPDGAKVLVSDKANNSIRVIDTADDSAYATTIPVKGNPDKVFFHKRTSDGRVFAFTANTSTSEAAVIDLAAGQVVTMIEAGDIARPEGAQMFHRDGLVAHGTFFTPASGDGVVAIIDAESLELRHLVPVAPGVDSVAYVGGGS